LVDCSKLETVNNILAAKVKNSFRLSLETRTVFAIFFLTASVHAQHPSIGGYHVYYGHLHNHTSYSDGIGTPAQAYIYAKETAKLDFFGLADHAEYLTTTEWNDTKAQANANNLNGVFAAFYGFEWTSMTYGDVSVINANDFTSSIVTNTFESLITWLSTRDVVAFFNHPGRDDNNGKYSYNSNKTPSVKIVGMELWNNVNGFSRYYYNTGYNPSDNKGNFDEALSKGWIIGAEGSGDNHSGTWGTSENYRMAILADNLTRDDLFDAMKARRFFSTLEPDIRLSFKVNGQEMGSAIPVGSYPVQIQASDGGGENFTKVVLYDKNHKRIKTWTPNTSSFTLNDNITATAGDYFYVKVLQADSSGSAGQAISSPIFTTSIKNNGDPTLQSCSGMCVTLESNISGGIPPYTYNWSPSSGLSSVTASNPVACPTVNSVYYVTVTDAIGCSAENYITVNIIPLPSNAGVISGNTNLCSGQENIIYSLPSINNATTYNWNLFPGATGTSEANSISVDYSASAVSGTITVSGHNLCGDGAASAIDVTLNPSYYFTENKSVCNGETCHWQGKDYSKAGTYTAYYSSINDCDSIYTLHLYVSPDYSFSENYSICNGETYHWQGKDYSKAGTYTAYYNSINGCDSIYTLHLTVNPVYSFIEDYNICDGETYNWQGKDYYTSGSYTAYYNSINGCDSIYTLHLTINPVYSFLENHTICKGEIYNWQGDNYNKAGTYDAKYTTINNCDSIYTLNLTIDSVDTRVSYAENTITTIAAADAYQWLDCNNCFQPIFGKFKRSFEVTMNGDYAVKMTQGTCIDTSECIKILTTGIAFPETKDIILIYPNPVSDELIIEMKGNTNNVNFDIVDYTGKVVYSGYLSERAVIQTGDFPPGVYLLRFKNDINPILGKILKND